MNSKWFPLLACLFAVLPIACKSTSDPTETFSGRFITASAHRVQFELEQPGSLSMQRVSPLSSNAKITLAGKPVPIEKIAPMTRIRITRDLKTKQVTRIDAQ